MGLEILSQALSTQQVLERMSDTVNYRLRIGSGRNTAKTDPPH